MVLDKNWGDVEVQIDKDTIEYIQLKNITIGGTTFDGFGSKLGVAEPSDVNINIKGFNSTVDMGFYVKLWLGDLHGTVSLDITDASLDVSTEWSNVAGAPQMSIKSCNFDIGNVSYKTDAPWTYNWIIKLLLPMGIKEAVKIVNSEVGKLSPIINTALAGLNYNVDLGDDITADLHLITGPAISSNNYIYGGLNATIYNSKDPYNPGYTPETLSTTFSSSVDLHIADYVPSMVIAMGRDLSYSYLNANLTTTTAAIVLPQLEDTYGADKVLKVELALDQTQPLPYFSSNNNTVTFDPPVSLDVVMSVETSPGNFTEAITLRVPVHMTVTGKLVYQFKLEGSIQDLMIKGIQVVDANLNTPVDPTEMETLLNDVLPLALNYVNEKLAGGLNLLTYLPSLAAIFIQQGTLTWPKGEIDLGIMLNP